MKFEKLYIKNLASIEEAEIDFEQGPLAEDSLFLICGETGAGKTTLLDAICLALFNNTPRMEQTKQESYSDTTDTPASAEQNARTDDPRQLLRRNTGEAIVQLDFTGSNGQKYTAIWNVYRSHRKTTGNLQEIKWSLTNQTNGQTLTRKSDVKEEISQAIGLTFEQFCRTTLLAQGDFTRFLKSDSKDKSDILEKLTGTEIYSRIGAQIYQTNKQKRIAAEQQKQKIENIQLLTSEDREQHRIQLALLAQNSEQLRQAQKGLQQIDQWLKRRNELAQQTATKQKELTRKQEELHSEKFQNDEKQLRQWQISADARNDYQQLNLLQERNKSLKNQLTETGKTFAALNQNLEQQKQGIEQNKNELAKTQHTLAAFAPISAMLEQEQALSASLRYLIGQRERLAKLLKNEQQLRQQIPLQEAKCSKLAGLCSELTEQIQKQQQEIALLQTQLAQKEPTKVLQEKERLEQERNLILPAQSAVVLLIERKKSRLQAEESCKNWQNKLQAVHEDEKKAQEQLLQAKTAAENFEQLYNRQKAAIENWACEARSRLRPGDTCPVCGQPVVHIPADENFRSLLAPMEEQLDLLKKQREQLDTAVGTLNAQRKAYEEQFRQAGEAHKTAASAFAEAYAQARELCAACGILTFEKDTPQQLEDRLKAVNSRLNLLQTAEQAINTLNQSITRMQQEKDQLYVRHQQLVQEKNREENQRTAIRQQADEQARQAETEQQAIREQEDQLATKILWEDWKTIWQEQPAELLKRLEQDGLTFRQTRDRQAQLEQQLALAENELREAERCRQAMIRDFLEWTSITVEKNTISPTGSVLSLWNDLQSQAYSLNQALSDLSSNLATYSKKLQDFLDRHPDIPFARLQQLAGLTAADAETLQNRLQQARDEETALRTSLKLAQEAEEQHAHARPASSPSVDEQSITEQLLAAEQNLLKTEQEIGRLKTILEEDQKRQLQFKTEQEAYRLLEAEYNRWNALCSYFGDQTGTKFRNIAQSYVLRELLHHANHYLRQFTDRYELTCPNISLTILIRDYYQGGTHRPTSTLSGGESFLVSLSLALGLSALTRGTHSVDTLFIDEGFGTLSSDYLNVVMDTLEKLHQLNGKRVGIISHVEGLRERIRTQIQVRRKDNSCSEIKTVCLN